MSIARADCIWWLTIPILTRATLITLGPIGTRSAEAIFLMRARTVEYTIRQLIHFTAQFERESGYDPFRCWIYVLEKLDL